MDGWRWQSMYRLGAAMDDSATFERKLAAKSCGFASILPLRLDDDGAVIKKTICCEKLNGNEMTHLMDLMDYL
jgi:hypothetical protein